MITNEDLYKLYQSYVTRTPVPSRINDLPANHLIATFNIAVLLDQPKTIDRIVKPNERFEFRLKCDKCEKYIKFQRQHLEYISNTLSNGHLPLSIIARGLTYWCPYCHHIIPYPKSVIGISDHKYVPTLVERVIEHDKILSNIDCYNGNPYLYDLKVHYTKKRKYRYPCPLVSGGLCPPECITNDGPLCDFDDDCPYLLKIREDD